MKCWFERNVLLVVVLALAAAVFGPSAFVAAQTEVRPMGSVTIVSGTTALSTTAAQVSTTATTVRELLVQCDVANAVDCYIGTATTLVVHLSPGQSLVIPIVNLNLLYAKTASSTATLNYLGRL